MKAICDTVAALASLFTIVPVAVDVLPSAALDDGFESVRVNVSSPSIVVSSTVGNRNRAGGLAGSDGQRLVGSRREIVRRRGIASGDGIGVIHHHSAAERAA